ncbi:S-adenosyl-L-methionine-dependent tRNA 4-demethylwyosine synthase TYW1-like [Uloborus diversus]|uniref:S-adenosyl-L-methionine-dependent tRNA 4-demethylwyosine synthase TYW1-like n=1 Tax=Uloborus diversus TaxID=327109 RepID=UPI00240A35E5|nr:S-adenosyl-L-methionine-dependent tRNA 4-demethylwyosine synthase TYW1-like [Uloborus diversus]
MDFSLLIFCFVISLITYFVLHYFAYSSIEEIEVDDDEKESFSTSCDIIYGTQTGNSKHFAEQLQKSFEKLNWETEVHDMKNLEPEEHLLKQIPKNKLCIFIISTYIDGQPPENCTWFCKWIEDASCDFRVSSTLFRGLKFAVFGCGSSLYEDNFNKASVNLHVALSRLGGSPILPLMKADENSSSGGLEESFDFWQKNLLSTVRSDEDNSVQNEIEDDVSESSDENDVMDVEELGHAVSSMKKNQNDGKEVKEMITPILRESLTKQGYKLLGSHSGVKMCRWTKSMLRGRGGCYKHTFYGIESHRCMETTPSLACANKCVFCWRHHTNPVGTEWKWKMDKPDEIVNLALKNHYNMIKEFKGVPGVKPERIAEGLEVKHCALSLVGEPIMYPEINALVELLHNKKISTFLVTNAQFPEAISKLVPVTQLYVSVDASNEQSLKKIDRPLFKDFWKRFIDSLTALSEKGQRTVYRLTLVKAWNTDEIEGYAKLVHVGKPDFIEIKGVTYCGTSKASSLTMENVPWHEEVRSFGVKLANYLPDYEMASEHEHSNCILIANKKFLINGRWHTWIDYEKFHELMKEYNNSEGEKTFTSSDYVSPTPSWAVIGSEEQGFDPDETRFFRKSKKDISGC